MKVMILTVSLVHHGKDLTWQLHLPQMKVMLLDLAHLLLQPLLVPRAQDSYRLPTLLQRLAMDLVLGRPPTLLLRLDLFNSDTGTEVSCAAGEVKATFTFEIDEFGSESYWQIFKDDDGSAVMNDGGYMGTFGTSYDYTDCLSSSACYTLTIFDSYGDGMNGMYTLNVDGTTVFSSATSPFINGHWINYSFNC